MKRLVIVLLLLTPWALHSMEPEEQTIELKQERVTQGRPSWVRLVEEVLPGEIPASTGCRISQVIAQELLRRKPELREFILDKISRPFRDFEGLCSEIYFDSSDDTMIMTNPRKARICKVASGKLKHTLELPNNFFGFKISPTRDKIILFPGRSVDIEFSMFWDVKSGTFLPLEGLNKNNRMHNVTFSQAGDKLAAGFENGTVMVWEAASGKLLYSLKGHIDDLVGLQFNRAGTCLATSFYDGTFNVWDVEARSLLHTLKDPSGGLPMIVGFNSTSDKLVTTMDQRKGSTEKSGPKIWDLTTETAFFWGKGRVRLSPAGDIVVIQGSALTSIWHIGNGENRQKNLLNSGRRGVWSFPPTNDKIITLQDNQVIIRDVDGNSLYSLGHGHVGEVVFSPAGDKILTIQDLNYDGRINAGQAERIKLWDVHTGKLLYIFDDESYRRATFNSAGDALAIIPLSNEVRIFDLEILLKSPEILEASRAFLREDITYRQVAILLDIHERIKNLRSPKASEEVPRAQEDCTFDFNNYPESIWDEYSALPEVIRRIFDPYITKPSSTKEEQAPKRLKKGS